MTDRSDVEVVRAIYDAMASDDVAALFELLDPAVVVTQDERFPWGGRHEGPDGFATLGLALTGAITPAVSIEAMFEAGGDIAEVHRWTIADGRAVRAHLPIDTPATLEALADT